MSSTLRRTLIAPSMLAAAALALAACDGQVAGMSAPDAAGTGSSTSSTPGSTSGSPSVAPAPTTPTVRLRTNTGKSGVAVDKVVTVAAKHGTLSKVTVTAGKIPLPGRLGADGTWTASSLLEPGTTYQVVSTATDAAGKVSHPRSSFTTTALTLDQQTFPSVAPLAGQTVGVGMPVIVKFDVPVSDKASIQKHLQVVSAPAQRGSWHWISDYEVHWRPVHYWKAGTTVTVNADVNSVPAGNGIFGQEDRHVTFHVGDAHIYQVNAQTDEMKVFSNGRLLRTLPVTTGKPGFVTRSGIKVIVEKKASTRMNSETIGIDPNSVNGYDLSDVQWAMRLTYTGEFVHAAPWSVAYQGSSNVSHGCTGLSTANAKWLYDMSRVGDVVVYTGTDKPMTLTNGFGDWNESFADYKQGSAL